jgi:hypothetical protein
MWSKCHDPCNRLCLDIFSFASLLPLKRGGLSAIIL